MLDFEIFHFVGRYNHWSSILDNSELHATLKDAIKECAEHITKKLDDEARSCIHKGLLKYLDILTADFKKCKSNNIKLLNFSQRMGLNFGTLQEFGSILFESKKFEIYGAYAFDIVSQYEYFLKEMPQKIKSSIRDNFRKLLAQHYNSLALMHLYLGELFLARSNIEDALDMLDEVSDANKSDQFMLIKSHCLCVLVDVELQLGKKSPTWASQTMETLLKLDYQHLGGKNSCRWIELCAVISEKWADSKDFIQAQYWLDKAKGFWAKAPQSTFLHDIQINLRDRLSNNKNYLQNHYDALQEILTKNSQNYIISTERNKLTISKILLPFSNGLEAKIKKILNDCKINIVQTSNIDSASLMISIEGISKLPVSQLEDLLLYLKKKQKNIEHKKQKFLEKSTNNLLESEALIVEKMENLTILPIISTTQSMCISNNNNAIKTQEKPLNNCNINSNFSSNSNSFENEKVKVVPVLFNKVYKQKDHKQVESKLSPSCDAQRLGFSYEIFGTATFHQCRSRSLGMRPIYVVYDGNKGKKIPAQGVEDDFIHYRFPNAKIVPFYNESGFKREQVEIKDPTSGKKKTLMFLYGKNPTHSWRLYPIACESNKNGETAYLFGKYFDTKKGDWEKKKLKVGSKCIYYKS